MERTFRHEAFSFFTHFAGALVGLVGLVALVVRAQTAAAAAAFAIYGSTLVTMFSASTLHHVRHDPEGIWRRLDMIAIYLFIAGTYTPICLLALPPVWGIPLLAVVWTLATIGVVLRAVRPLTPRWVSAALYLGLGWLAVVGAVPIVTHLPWEAVALLVAGGLVYTVGAIVYARGWPDPWPRYVGHHGLWHLFVLTGAGLHFLLIWKHVPPS